MFGNHSYAKAIKLAKRKSKELGKECTVLPAEEKDADGNELWTIGVPVRAYTFDDVVASIRAKQEGKE